MVYLIVFLPLLGSIIAGFFGRKLGDKFSLYLTSSLLIILSSKLGIELIATKNTRAAIEIASYLYLFQMNNPNNISIVKDKTI